MKIGLFTDSFLPSHDGVATSVALLAKELDERGHDVIVVCPNQPHYKDPKYVYRLFSIRLMEKPEIWAGLEIPQLALLKISEIDFDIIHGHSGGPVSLLGWQIAQIRNIPFVETYHTMWRHYRHYFRFPNMLKGWMIKKISEVFGNDCDALIAPTEKVQRELKSYGIKRPIFVIPSGISLEQFENNKTGYLHKKLDIPKNTKIILSVGRLEKEKSIDFLIKSFSHAKSLLQNCVLVVIGEGRDKSKMNKLIKSLKIEDMVFLIDSVSFSDMPYVYADADLFVFASQSETQGMAIIEALASEVPVVAVRDSAYESVIINGQNGFMVKKDLEEFAKKITDVITDEKLYRRLKISARKSVAQFSVKNTVESLEQVYTQLIIQKSDKKPMKLWKRISNPLIANSSDITGISNIKPELLAKTTGSESFN
jgi:1,2-diacylglycerol 3-alpha-glucosyltransferase